MVRTMIISRSEYDVNHFIDSPINVQYNKATILLSLQISSSDDVEI